MFAYVSVQKQGLRFTVFTNGKRLAAVDSLDYERGGEKWDACTFKSQTDLKPTAKALKVSYERLVEAIRRGENTDVRGGKLKET